MGMKGIELCSDVSEWVLFAMTLLSSFISFLIPRDVGKKLSYQYKFCEKPYVVS